jgi:hypothetical protein
MLGEASVSILPVLDVARTWQEISNDYTEFINAQHGYISDSVQTGHEYVSVSKAGRVGGTVFIVIGHLVTGHGHKRAQGMGRALGHTGAWVVASSKCLLRASRPQN